MFVHRSIVLVDKWRRYHLKRIILSTRVVRIETNRDRTFERVTKFRFRKQWSFVHKVLCTCIEIVVERDINRVELIFWSLDLLTLHWKNNFDWSKNLSKVFFCLTLIVEFLLHVQDRVTRDISQQMTRLQSSRMDRRVQVFLLLWLIQRKKENEKEKKKKRVNFSSCYVFDVISMRT